MIMTYFEILACPRIKGFKILSLLNFENASRESSETIRVIKIHVRAKKKKIVLI